MEKNNPTQLFVRTFSVFVLLLFPIVPHMYHRVWWAPHINVLIGFLFDSLSSLFPSSPVTEQEVCPGGPDVCRNLDSCPECVNLFYDVNTDALIYLFHLIKILFN